MKQRKILSCLLAVSMILTMIVFPQISYAAGTPQGIIDKSDSYSTDRGDIVYTYLGTSKAMYDDENYDNDPFADTHTLSDLENTNQLVWEDGGLVWIGVQLENMDRLKTMFNTDNFTPSGNGNQDTGLGSIVCGLAYDTDYFSDPACEENNATVLTKGNYPTQSTSNATPLYSLSTEPTVTYESLRAEGMTAKDTIKLLKLTQKDESKINVTKVKANTADGMTKARRILMVDGAAIGGTATDVSADPMLLFAIPLKMKGSTPPAAGTKVIEGYFDKVYSTLAVGTSTATGVAYEYDVNREHGVSDELTGTAGDTNLNNRFNILSMVNLFPGPVDVTYDANASGDPAWSTAGWDSSVTDGVDNVEHTTEDVAPTGKNNAGTVISTLLTPPDGYIFNGWYMDSACTIPFTTVDSSKVSNGKLTVYANYMQGHKATFHLNGDGASFADDNSTTDRVVQAESGDPLFASGDTYATKLGGDPVRTGYAFQGWYTKNATTGAFETKIPDTVLTGADTTTLSGFDAENDSIEVYGQWLRDPAGTNTLNFDVNTTDNGVTQPNPAQITYNAGDTLNSVLGGLPSEPTRTGYKFMGWYKSKNGDGTKLEAGTPLDTYMGSENTVYARWDYLDDPIATPTPLPYTDTITVHFEQDSTGGTYADGTYVHGTVADKYIKLGDALEYVPVSSEFTYTDTSKSFAGWYTRPQNDPDKDQAVKIAVKTATDAGTLFNNTLDNNGSLANGGTVKLYPWYTEKVTVSYDMNGFGYPATITPPSSVTDFPNATFTVAATPTATDYIFKEWNTKADGSGDKYTAGDTTAVIPGSNTTLYAIYQYDGGDKIKVVFNGNATTTNAADFTPDDGNTPETYTMYRKPNATITADQMPSVTRNKYTFDHYGEAATEAVGGTTQAITIPASLPAGQTQIDRYAIWRVTNPADLITVTFHSNRADAQPTTDTVIQVADGDTISTSAVPTYTATGWSLKGWSETQTATTADYDFTVALSKASDDPLNLYGIWAQEVKVTYNLNGGTLTSGAGSADPVTLDYNGTLAGLTPAKTVPTVEKGAHTFDGWKYKDSSNNIHTFDANTNVTEDITVYATWTATIKVDYNDAAGTASGSSEYTYDGTAQTPIKTANLKVTLLNDDGSDNSVITGVTENDFTATYQLSGTTPDNFTPTVPINAGLYDIELEINTNNSPSVLDLEWTTYTINPYPNFYTIEGIPVNYIISRNYRYEDPFDTTSQIGIAVDGTAPTGLNIAITDILNTQPIGTSMITGGRTADLDIKFINKKDTSEEFVNTMPTHFGDYTVVITASTGSNYSVGTITDSLAAATPAGDGDLHIIRSKRKITFNYTDPTDPTLVGYKANAGVATTDTTDDWTTVTIPAPNPLTNVQAAITSFNDQTPSVSLPVEGTDFVPPTGKTLVKFVIETDTDNDGVKEYTTEFDPSAIKPGDDLVVYATYKDASWTMTFEDTKAGAAKENTLKYTVTANKGINDTDEAGTGDSVTKIEDVTASQDITSTVTNKRELPKPANVADGYAFYGWTTDQTLAATANLKASDLTDAQKATIVTKDDYPTKAGTALAGVTSQSVTVYALYVLSSDTTLSKAEFYELDSTGALIPYVESDFRTADTFDPTDTTNTTYYLIASNAAKDVYFDLAPSNSQSTLKVSFTPDPAQAAQTLTTKTGTLTGLKVADNKSVNVVTVEVTAPDGSTMTYTFNILRKEIPGIKLGYGNSPAGLIYRMGEKATDPWSEATIQTALEKFNDNGAQDKKYDSNYVPDDGNTTLLYTTVAWNSYKDSDENIINYDLDPTSLFVYQGSTFTDTSAVPKNELGETLTGMTRTFKVKEQSFEGVSTYTGNDTADKVNEVDAPLVDGTKDQYTLDGKVIRTDVYKIDYSCTYTDLSGTSQTLTASKPVIILGKMGDLYLSSTIAINDSDANYLKKQTTKVYQGNSLIAYRCADFDAGGTAAINDTDANYLKKNTTKVYQSTNQYYKPWN